MAGFFVCGWSTNGLVGTHFISAAHDHGLPITTGATLLAFIGIFDVIGTIGSGWLTDRFGLSWQIIPTRLGELAGDPDPGRSSRTIAAMLKMSKLDIAGLQAAYDGA